MTPGKIFSRISSSLNEQVEIKLHLTFIYESKKQLSLPAQPNSAREGFFTITVFNGLPQYMLCVL
jgi:hypothetical protein